MKKLLLPLNSIFLVFVLIWIISACSQAKDYGNDANVSTSQFSRDVNTAILNTEKDLETIYNKHSLLWLNDSLTLNKEGQQLLNTLANAYAYGLPPSIYNVQTNKDLSDQLINSSVNERIETATKLETQLTKSYISFGQHLQKGIVDTSDYKYEFLKQNKVTDPLMLLSDDDMENFNQLLLLQPQSPEYIDLQKGLENYLSSHSIVDSSIIVPTFKDDSIYAYQKAKEALIIHSYLDSSTSNRDTILAALVQFQIDHGLTPDSLIGKNTANALSENPYHNLLKACVTLQKLRWDTNWTQPYILANIPGFTIRIRNDNKILLENRVVVGIVGKETPELESSLQYLVVYPFWNVPYSIKTEEIIPKLKKDSTYLQRNGYELMSGNKVVSYSSLTNESIQSGNVPYSIRQKGGRSNALGLIKFIFPNKYSVYFHDTPSKSFFYNDVRAYSHGCVRVQQPLSIAEKILELDNNPYNIDSVNAFINRKERKTITLKTKIGVYLRYYTTLSSNGKIVFYTDLYHKDQKLMKIMENLFANSLPL